jgi:hypothetical protein
MLSRDGERVIEVVLLAAIVAVAIGSRAGLGPPVDREATQAPSAPTAFHAVAEAAGDGTQGPAVDALAGHARAGMAGPFRRLGARLETTIAELSRREPERSTHRC